MLLHRTLNSLFLYMHVHCGQKDESVCDGVVMADKEAGSSHKKVLLCVELRTVLFVNMFLLDRNATVGVLESNDICFLWTKAPAKSWYQRLRIWIL